MMSLTRSVGIVEKFCSTGTTALPSVASFLSDLPGLAVHVVLADQRLRLDLAARVLAQVREPRLGHLGLDEGECPPVLLTMSKPVVCPAVTPPILKSPCSTRPNALSNSIL
jgi:hypothetical protein